MWWAMRACALLEAGEKAEQKVFCPSSVSLINHLASCCLRATRNPGTCGGRTGTCEPMAVSGRAWCWAQLWHVVWVGQGPVCRGARGPLFLGRISPEEETSLGYLASPKYKGLGWVLEVEKEMVKKIQGMGLREAPVNLYFQVTRPW